MAQPTNPDGLFSTCHRLRVTRIGIICANEIIIIKNRRGKKREWSNIIIGVNDLEKTH